VGPRCHRLRDGEAEAGDDEEEVVARNVLREEWGEVGTGFEDGETYVGTLESWDENGFVLDAGARVRIPADELGLGPGSPSQIRDRFGLVQHLLNRAGHARDIVTVERLGLLEQSAVCTEGTDPPGLLASVGEYLPAELKCVIP